MGNYPNAHALWNGSGSYVIKQGILYSNEDGWTSPAAQVKHTNAAAWKKPGTKEQTLDFPCSSCSKPSKTKLWLETLGEMQRAQVMFFLDLGEGSVGGFTVTIH